MPTKKATRAGAANTLRLTLFPNNELRIRIPPPVTTKWSQGGGAFSGKLASSILSIAQNLQKNFQEAIRPPKSCDRTKSGYGVLPRGVAFSKRGRRLMVRAGSLLGSGGYGSNNLFLTGTLPGSTPAAFEAVAAWSSWAVHLLLTRLCQLAQSPASECRWIWCWEYQQRGALHWHAVLKLPDFKARDRVLKGFTGLWNSVLKGIARKSGVDIFERLDGGTWAGCESVWRSSVEILRKRADRYLAKYLSKTAGKEDAKFFPPTRWYGLSRSLHRELKDATRHVETCDRTKEHVVSEEDLGIIKQLIETASLWSHYPDKIGSGQNFVMYFNEGKQMDEARRIFGNLERTYEFRDTQVMPAPHASQYQALVAVTSRPHILERYLNDLGPFYRRIYYWWMDEDDRAIETDLFWLEYYARRLCFITGIQYKGQPPERSGAGLPGTPIAKMESPPPPEAGLDQQSLFP